MLSFRRRRDTNAKQLLGRVLGDYELPAFPTAVMKALQEIRSPHSSAASISQLLEMDPGLSVRVLRAANSASFSPVKKVTNLSQAVALVGGAQLEAILLAVGVAAVLPGGSVAGFDFRRFWTAAATRAEIARALAGRVCPPRATESFTVGFLQDMAVPLLAHRMHKQYGPILEQWHREGEDLAKLERTCFPWDHAEVAGWICREWNLPEAIASSITGHHRAVCEGVDDADPTALVACLGEGDGPPGLDRLFELCEAQLDLSTEELKELIESSLVRAQQLAASMLS